MGWARLVAVVSGFALVVPLVATVAPSLSVDPYVAYMLAFCFVSASAIVSAVCAPELRTRALIWTTPALAILVAVALLGAALPIPIAAPIVTFSLLWAGVIVGAVVGWSIEDAGHLLPVAIISALVDAFSVLHPSGPTAAIVEAPRALAVLALPWPMLGTADIVPILGVGDVVFAGLYVAVSRRHALPLWRTLLALGLGFVVVMGLVMALGVPLPALPALAAAIVLAHPQARRLRPKDRRSTLVVTTVIVVLFLALWIQARVLPS